MSGDTLFSAGFDWSDDVATDATPVATPASATTTAAPATLSQPAATVAATPGEALFSGDFDWSAPDVASVASVAAEAKVPEAVAVSRPISGTPVATPETADFCGVQADSHERVADVASVAGWREGVELLTRGRCPKGYDPRRWRQLVADARALVQNWGPDFHAQGWTTLEVFGVNPDPRRRGKGSRGLLPVLQGRAVEAVDRDTALIRAGRVDRQTYQRRLVAPGGVPVWERVLGARQ
jgi:hypothetical protein